MFKKVASDALGLSDIGKIISPDLYGETEADDYVLQEDAEKIYFLIKTKSDEYCFTNLALIHVDGTTAMSKKRVLRRLDYFHHTISDVLLETAGNMDRDVEIKFRMGSTSYSIDVDKKQIEKLKDLYKALVRISIIQEENAKYMAYASQSLDTTAKMMPRYSGTAELADQFESINQYSFDWLKNAYDAYTRKDFAQVFTLYINN